MYILQGDLGFIFNPHKEIRPPPPPFFQKSDLSLPNTSPLSRNNLRLFANNPALLRNTRALLKVHKKSRTFCALFLKKKWKKIWIFQKLFVPLQYNPRADCNMREGPPDVAGPTSF